MSDPNKDGKTEQINIQKSGEFAVDSPLNSLEQNKYIVSKPLKYPSELGTDPRFPHFIKFNINQPATSRYNKIATTGISQIDQNRALNNQLGGQSNGINNNAVKTGAIVSAVWAAQEFLGDAASQAKNVDVEKAVGAAAGTSTILSHNWCCCWRAWCQ